MNSPYQDLPPSAFWRTGVAARAPLDPGALYTPKFEIGPRDRIVTAGSCFAQHVGRALKGAGCTVVDTEPLEAPIDDAEANRFGYRLYSARYGNIYTSRQLLQLAREVAGDWTPAEAVWEKDGRYYDALRPSVEPEGLASPEEVQTHRRHHLENVGRAFDQASVFVFTFGLTETWMHRESGTVYPTAPGTIAGRHDPETFAFHNLGFAEVRQDFIQFRRLMRARNRRAKFLVTVSPVPLTATASGHHVEVATVYSKSVLRAVCGELSDSFDDVAYFPSYEVITSPANHGAYFMPNRRSVAPQGVAAAMKLFLDAHGFAAAPTAPAPAEAAGRPRRAARPAPPKAADEDDVICEEALLDAFAR